MSKFDSVFKRISEQTGTAVPPKPVVPGAAPQQQTQQQTPQQQQQAIQQAAKLLNMDPKALEQILVAQQKPAAGTAQQTNQPAV